MIRVLYFKIALAYYTWLGYPKPFLSHYHILLNLEKEVYRAWKKVMYQRIVVWYYKIEGAPSWVVWYNKARLRVYKENLRRLVSKKPCRD